jgi:hypothetical protein
MTTPFKHLLTLSAAALILPSAAHSQPTCDLPLQAYVTDDAGAPVDGALDLELRFYTDSAPDAVAAECRSFDGALAEGGWIRVTVDACGPPPVGDCGALSLSDLLNDGARDLWVGFTVGGDELEPRLALGSVPFAVHSARAGDAATLEGLSADAFEPSGVVAAHTADPDAHHSATSDGIVITPSSVQVGDTHIDDGSVDLGLDADDELTAEIVQTLTGGGDADALHGHTAGDAGVGGACLTAWGRSDCPADFALFYAGVAVQGYGAHRDFGSEDTLTMALGETLCVDPAGMDGGSSFSPTYYTAGLVELGATTIHQSSSGLACAVCCR